MSKREPLRGVVAPATPRDVLGLLPTAIRDDDPTVVILHKGLLQLRCFDHLDAPVTRLGGPFTPVPFAPSLERAHRPDAMAIAEALRELLK